MDVYFTLDPETEIEKRKARGKQSNVDENTPYNELKEQAHQCIARWIYDCGIPLNAVNYDSFEPMQPMLEVIVQYDPGLAPLSYYQVCVPLFKKEVDNVNKQMEDHQKVQEESGCNLMCDGWTNRRNRTLLNFLVNCPKGTNKR